MIANRYGIMLLPVFLFLGCLCAHAAEGETQADRDVARSKSMTSQERRTEEFDLQAKLRLDEIRKRATGKGSGVVSLIDPLSVSTKELTPTQRLNRRFKYNDPVRVRWALDLNNRRITDIWTPPTGLKIEFVLCFTDQNDLIAVQMHTGKPLWWTRTAAPLTGKPFFTKNHIYITVRDHVTMIERFTGRAIWSVPLPFAPSSGPIAIEPKEGEPMIYISSLSRTTYGIEIFREIWPPTGRMQALTRDHFQMEQFTPFVNWRLRTLGIAKAEPAYGHGRLVVGDWRGNIYGINTRKIVSRTPRDFWVQSSRGAIMTQPLVQATQVFAVSSDQSVCCFSVNDGTRFWRILLAEPVTKQPQYVSDLIARKEFLLCSTGEKQAVVALDPENGNPKWQLNDGDMMVAYFKNKEKADIEKMVAVIIDKNNIIHGVPLSKPLVVSKEEQERNAALNRFPTPNVAWQIQLNNFTPFAANATLPYIFTATEDSSVICALERNSLSE